MSRANKRDTDLRHYLETIAGEVAHIQRVSPVTKQRICQGLEHTGMTNLFQPALTELDDVARSVGLIRQQVASALQVLMKK